MNIILENHNIEVCYFYNTLNPLGTHKEDLLLICNCDASIRHSIAWDFNKFDHG